MKADDFSRHSATLDTRSLQRAVDLPSLQQTLYTLCPKKVVHQTHGDNFVNNLTDFQNFFTAGNPGKFYTKPI